MEKQRERERVDNEVLIFAVATILYEAREADIRKRNPRNGWVPIAELYKEFMDSLGYVRGFSMTQEEFHGVLKTTPNVSKWFSCSPGKDDKPVAFRYNANGKPM